MDRRTAPIAIPLVAAALAAVVSACGQMRAPSEPRIGLRPPESNDSDVRSADGSGGGGAGGAEAGEGGEVGGDGAAEGGEGGGAEAGAGDAGETPDACTPAASVPGAQPVLKALPYAREGTQVVLGIPLAYTASIASTRSITVAAGRAVATTAITVTATPPRAQRLAVVETADLAGTVTTELVPETGRRALLGGGAWDGLECVLQPAVRTSAARGDKTVVATFSPPLPSMISPELSGDQLAALLASGRIWTGIEATIESSDDAAVKTGSRHVGTVALRPIANVETLTTGGKSVTVGGDVGYELLVDFGDPKLEAALGLAHSTRFYLNKATTSFKSIVVDGDGSGDADAVVYVGGR